jgi:hypothetical protein
MVVLLRVEYAVGAQHAATGSGRKYLHHRDPDGRSLAVAREKERNPNATAVRVTTTN